MTIPSPDRPSLTADVLVATAFVLLSQIEIWVFTANDDYDLWVRVAVAVLVTIAGGVLAWRRSNPGLSFWVNSAAVMLAIAVGFDTDVYQWTNLVALYSIGAYGSPRQSWLALPGALAGVSFYFLRFPFEGGAVTFGFVVAIWIVGWLTGRTYGARMAHTRLMAERDLSIEVAKARQERIDLDAARSRIARELHDIIGHAVNLMVVHAGAGRGTVGQSPDATIAAFELIEETGRTALSELDHVLALLHDDADTGQLSPLPGIREIADLAARVREGSLEVSVGVSGEIDSVPVGVGLASYRIVQEGLTNVMKHANATSAEVSIAVLEKELTVSVKDDGVGIPPSLATGRGVTGMKERVSLHDGELRLRNHDDGPGASLVATLRWEEP